MIGEAQMNATPVTTEVLENLTCIAARVQQHKPELDPVEVSRGVTKLQKIAVSLRKSGGTGPLFTRLTLRACEIANELGIVFHFSSTGEAQTRVTIGDWDQRI
jgi:hypothetical protein